MITDENIAAQVAESLTTWPDDFNIPGIVAEITATYGLVGIDTIDDTEYWALVARHHISRERTER